MGGRKQAGEEELQEGGKALLSRLLFRSTVDGERKDTEMVGRSMEEQLSQKHSYKETSDQIEEDRTKRIPYRLEIKNTL